MPDTEKSGRHEILPSDIDAHGNVVVWDHGPAEVDYPDAAAQYKAEDDAWHLANGPGPVAITMDKGNAAHSLSVEPERYALEPLNLDDGAINAKVKDIQDQRAQAKKVAEDREAALQLNVDRKAAVSAVMADRAVAAANEPKPKVHAPLGQKPPAPLTSARLTTGADEAKRISDAQAARAAAAKAEADRNEKPMSTQGS